jgi:dipeptidyl aminopeptidase/acylaminoacyl peptidase
MKTSVPVLIAHGSDDEVVSLASTMAAVDAMVAAGSEVRLAVLDGVPHGFYVHDAHLQAARGPIEGLSRLEASP